jgi:hypothetical protein
MMLMMTEWWSSPPYILLVHLLASIIKGMQSRRQMHVLFDRGRERRHLTDNWKGVHEWLRVFKWSPSSLVSLYSSSLTSQLPLNPLSVKHTDVSSHFTHDIIIHRERDTCHSKLELHHFSSYSDLIFYATYTLFLLHKKSRSMISRNSISWSSSSLLRSRDDVSLILFSLFCWTITRSRHLLWYNWKKTTDDEIEKRRRSRK